MHHIIRRSQGGTDDPDNLVPLCHACHMGHHDGSGERLEFEYNLDGKLCVWRGGLLPVVVADPNRDPVPFDDPPEFEDAIADINELLDTIATADYYLGKRLDDAKRLAGKEALQLRLSDRVAPQSFGSWLSNRIAYASLPEYAEVLRLGVTRGVAVSRLVGKGHDLAQVLHDLNTMPWSQFDAEYKRALRADRS